MAKSDTYKTILVICLGLLILFHFFQKSFLLYSSIGIGILSLLSPRIGIWIEKAWFGLATILGKVNGLVLLSLVFFLFLLPLGLFYRLFSSNPLFLKNESDSLFVERNLTYTPEELENPW